MKRKQKLDIDIDVDSFYVKVISNKKKLNPERKSFYLPTKLLFS